MAAQMTVPELFDYVVRIDFAATWFPTQAGSALEAPRYRAGTIHMSSADYRRDSRPHDSTVVINPGDYPANLGEALIQVRWAENGPFQVEVQFSESNGQTFALPPNSRIPFAISHRDAPLLTQARSYTAYASAVTASWTCSSRRHPR